MPGEVDAVSPAPPQVPRDGRRCLVGAVGRLHRRRAPRLVPEPVDAGDGVEAARLVAGVRQLGAAGRVRGQSLPRAGRGDASVDVVAREMDDKDRDPADGGLLATADRRWCHPSTDRAVTSPSPQGADRAGRGRLRRYAVPARRDQPPLRHTLLCDRPGEGHRARGGRRARGDGRTSRFLLRCSWTGRPAHAGDKEPATWKDEPTRTRNGASSDARCATTLALDDGRLRAGVRRAGGGWAPATTRYRTVNGSATPVGIRLVNATVPLALDRQVRIVVHA